MVGPRVPSGRVLVLAAVAMLAVVGAVAGLGGLSAGDDGSTAPQPTRQSDLATSAAPAPESEAPGAAVPGPAAAVSVPVARGARPTRIQIPAIGVDAATTQLGIGTDGAIEVPSDPDDAGWLDTSPAPGERGPAVLAGHVDSETGPAVFYRLGSLAVGDEVLITRGDGAVVRFTVDGVRTYPQSDFPTRQVYGPVPGPALRLITCGGTYDDQGGGYQSNVVVYAS